jgi:DNA-binding response OmpR family regulator
VETANGRRGAWFGTAARPQVLHTASTPSRYTFPVGAARGGEARTMAGERILVAEDDTELRPVICQYLRSEGYVPVETGDGAETLLLWERQRPDLIVLDWMLPGRSGVDVARQIRSSSGAAAATPIIMLTARSEEPDVILGLEVGADDYLAKPVSLRLLAARIRAVLRRAAARSVSEADIVALGDLVLDLAGHEARRGGEPLTLTATEFRLLAVLARSPGRVFSRLQLMEAAVGDYYEGYERTIDSHISHLRHKLGPGSLIQTVHGIGYKLLPPRP